MKGRNGSKFLLWQHNLSDTNSCTFFCQSLFFLLRTCTLTSTSLVENILCSCRNNGSKTMRGITPTHVLFDLNSITSKIYQEKQFIQFDKLNSLDFMYYLQLTAVSRERRVFLISRLCIFYSLSERKIYVLEMIENTLEIGCHFLNIINYDFMIKCNVNI